MVGHRQEFERELGAIEAKVIELFAMVAEDLPGATQALLTGNNDVVKTLTEREQAIDALYPEIEAMANREIVLQAPVASDLRFLLSVLRIVHERDNEMDELYASVMAELASGRMALPVTMEMTLVARFYERLGDHAVNIARRVVYLAGSQDPLNPDTDDERP